MPKLQAITLKQLRTLVALAENGTITAAANAVGLTPPAAHTQLKTLSNNFGTDLVRRMKSGAVEITEAGWLAIKSARRIDSEMKVCIDDVRALSAGRAGVVRLGVVSTGKYFAPGLVAELKKVYPDIDLRLTVGNRDLVVAAIDTRAVQLAIMGRPPRVPAVTARVLGPHPSGLIAPPGHRLAGHDPVPAGELLKETFISREEGSGTRLLMLRYLDRIGEGRPFSTVEMGSNETIKQAVIAGLGIAVLSLHTVTEELRTGRLVQLEAEGMPVVRNWYLLHRSDTDLTPAAEQVRAYIAEQEGRFLPEIAAP